MSKKNIKGRADIEKRPAKENLQYKFSNPELLELGRTLAEAQEQLRQYEDDKKQAMDEWKSRVSTKEAEINGLSNRVSRGYEYRDIECEITVNDPPGKKTCRRLDTAEVVWVRDLSEDEKQRTLELEADNGGESEE